MQYCVTKNGGMVNKLFSKFCLIQFEINKRYNSLPRRRAWEAKDVKDV